MKLETGMVWETDKGTFANTILIIAVSSDAVKAVFHVKGMSDSVQQTLCLENFIQLLSDGGYQLRSPGMSGSILKPESVLKLSTTMDTGKKYLRTIRSKWQRGSDGKLLAIEADIYCIIDAFGPFSAAMNHAIKKVLCPGQRGSKDKITDLKEAIVSIQHEIDSETEFAQPEEKTERKKKEVITPPPQDRLPKFIQNGDQIFYGELELKENCHEFYNYTSVRGQGLRQEKRTWCACRFCGKLLEEYDDKSQCPKLNSP